MGGGAPIREFAGAGGVDVVAGDELEDAAAREFNSARGPFGGALPDIYEVPTPRAMYDDEPESRRDVEAVVVVVVVEQGSRESWSMQTALNSSDGDKPPSATAFATCPFTTLTITLNCPLCVLPATTTMKIVYL